MAAKPNPMTILQTYSLTQLLDLVKEKAQMDAEEQLENVKQQVSALAQTMGGAIKDTNKNVIQPALRRRGRPKKSESDVEDTGKGSPRGGKKVPLGKLLQDVLQSEPMGIDEIMAALKEHGYKSKSKDPRRVLYLELKKQVEKKALKKTGRGMYTLK